MNAKYSLALIALIGIGVFALPATTALFSGQHSFYNIDATGNQIPCTKCHGDIKSELTSNVNTDPTQGPLTAGPHANFKCEYCHRVEAGRASGDDAYGLLIYGNKTTGVRYLVVTLPDFEGHNYPNAILSIGNLSVATGSWKFLGCCSGSLPSGNAALSPDDAVVGAPPSLNLSEIQEFPLYNTNTGLPKDNNSNTQNSGFNPTKIVSWNIYINGTGAPSLANVPVLDGAGSRVVNPGTTYHAASLVSCLECHGGEKPAMSTLGNDDHHTRIVGNSSVECQNCHYGTTNQTPGTAGSNWYYLAAGGFGLGTNTKYDNPNYIARDMGNLNDTGELEAHKAWVTKDDNLSRFSTLNGTLQNGANNNACVGCHTHVAVEINFKKGYLLQFNATETASGNYSVDNFSVQGTVGITTYGNSSGNAFAVSNNTYSWNDANTTLYINGTSVVVGLNQAANDSIAALT